MIEERLLKIQSYIERYPDRAICLHWIDYIYPISNKKYWAILTGLEYNEDLKDAFSGRLYIGIEGCEEGLIRHVKGLHYSWIAI